MVMNGHGKCAEIGCGKSSLPSGMSLVRQTILYILLLYMLFDKIGF